MISKTTKRKSNLSADFSALAFLNGIESKWRGHIPFVLWLVKTLKPKVVVDLGIDRGLSTICFAYKNRGKVFGIDWFDEVDYLEKCFALDSACRNISNALRLHYVENIHLTIGPFKEVLSKWDKKIDILHIDGVSSYLAIKKRFEDWTGFLNSGGVVLIHGIQTYPDETGRFFDEISMDKIRFPYEKGLGVLSNDKELIEIIRKTTFVVS